MLIFYLSYQDSRSDAIQERVKQLQLQYAGKRIIFARDHLDKVNGVSQRLCAFERFLEKHPEWREQVVMIQISAPRYGPPKLEQEIAEHVAKINSQYGSLSHLPCIHYAADVDLEDHFALLYVADVALITSVRDGMSTTSLEYVAAQRDRKGVLILSEFTGTAGSLYGALLVNPWDYSVWLYIGLIFVLICIIRKLQNQLMRH